LDLFLPINYKRIVGTGKKALPERRVPHRRCVSHDLSERPLHVVAHRSHNLQEETTTALRSSVSRCGHSYQIKDRHTIICQDRLGTSTRAFRVVVGGGSGRRRTSCPQSMEPTMVVVLPFTLIVLTPHLQCKTRISRFECFPYGCPEHGSAKMLYF
jgi:hypothetical protein